MTHVVRCSKSKVKGRKVKIDKSNEFNEMSIKCLFLSYDKQRHSTYKTPMWLSFYFQFSRATCNICYFAPS